MNFRIWGDVMPVVIGGLMAITALAASVFAGVEPTGALLRGLIAFAIGSISAQIWQAFASRPKATAMRRESTEGGATATKG